MKLKNISAITTAFFLLSISTISLADVNDPAPRILVTGQGSVNVAPDMAILNLTVMREADTAREALKANSAAMSDVLAAMKAEGVKPRDLQTSGFSIQPRYSYPAPGSSGEREERKIVGYTVRNSLTVRVRDIAAIGEILDRSITLGVNQGGNFTLTNNDPSVAITEARTLAMQDALAKATTLAEAAGVKVGRLLEISEHSQQPRPMRAQRAEMSMVMADNAVPVAGGENTYKVSVNLSIAIEQ